MLSIRRVLLRPEIDKDQVVPSFAFLVRLEGTEETDRLRRAGAAVPTQRVSPAPGADLKRPATGLGFKVIESRSLARKGRADPDAAATEAVRNADLGRQGLGKWMRRRGRRHRHRCRNWWRGAVAANRRRSTPPPQAGSIRPAAMTVAAKPRGCVSQGHVIAACTSSLLSQATSGLRQSKEALDVAHPVRLGSPSFAKPEA